MLGIAHGALLQRGVIEHASQLAEPRALSAMNSTDEGQDVDSESLRGESAAAAVPGQCLWEPIASVGRSSSPQITSGGAAVRDGIAPGQGNDGEGIQARRPVFESILVFGGIGGSAVSEVSPTEPEIDCFLKVGDGSPGRSKYCG